MFLGLIAEAKKLTQIFLWDTTQHDELGIRLTDKVFV